MRKGRGESGSAGPPAASSSSGSGWQLWDVDENGGLLTITCPARTFCVAGDSDGDVSFWNGSTWSAMETADSSGGYMNSVSCAIGGGRPLCAAVDNEGYIAMYEGGQWDQPQQVDPNGNGLVRGGVVLRSRRCRRVGAYVRRLVLEFTGSGRLE